MTSYNELLAERERLTAEIEAARVREARTVLDEIKRMMAEYGITVADLGARRYRRFGSAPRYCDPATGKTWSGYGRPPEWIVGRDRKKYLIG